MLGQASGTVVAAKEIRWEASPGLLRETFLGRRVLFLGAKKQGQPRDVYRAAVRVSVDGKPFAVREVRNLTDTSLGDDAGLELRGSTAAFATVAYGNIQSITLLEMSGARKEDRPRSWFHRVLQTVTSYQEVGSLDGLGRTDVVLELPAKQAELLLDPPNLRIDLGEKGRSLLLNTETRELNAAEGGQAYAARTVVHRQHPKPLILWGVDTVRAEVGPEPIAWLEDKVFGAKDKFKRTTYNLLSSGSSQDALKEDVSENLAARVLDATHLADNQ
ncbi:MAG TPA: hypothetical protein PKD61_37185, partial [Polyangiaceae bacterium]|nr:hypothetical protein [Polyangiaceae bacterium]